MSMSRSGNMMINSLHTRYIATEREATALLIACLDNGNYDDIDLLVERITMAASKREVVEKIIATYTGDVPALLMSESEEETEETEKTEKGNK